MANKLILVGVGHVFQLEDKIREIIEEEKPDAIALELDEGRAIALEKKSNSKGNFIYSLLSKVQQIVASKYGVVAGNEMLSALKIARDKNIPVLYIDMNAYEVIEELWKKISIRRKLSLFISAILTMFMSKERIEKEVKEFEKEPEKFEEKLRKIFPEFVEILIDKRNEYMVNNLLSYLPLYEKIVVIVGEGHVKGMEELLKRNNVELKTIHLSQLIE